jgi:hypothetical protein
MALGVAPADPGSSSSNGPRLLVGPPLRLVPEAGGAFMLEGNASVGALGDPRTENPGPGVRLDSAASGEKPAAGAMSWTVAGVSANRGRWYRLRVRGLAQENFRVEKDQLFLRAEFFKDNGKNPLDLIKKSIYEKVERDRLDLADSRTNRNLGPATWRSYIIDFKTPFPEVDTLRLSVGFALGAGKGPRSEFWIDEVEIQPIPAPADYRAPAHAASTPHDPPAIAKLLKLGGRWYFDGAGSNAPPARIDYTNADRLYYLSDRLETPFAGNMTSWMRKGYLDRSGKLVDQDRFVPDNVAITFTDKYLVMKSKNLPNHPTAVFPDRWRVLDGNPNYIQEQDHTWYLPLEPKENPHHIAMDATNSNRALPGGPIGVAINGINFHNPFDERVYEDAVWRLDRCCGHPSPLQNYHYHKYPVCINTPFDDNGERHSPVIGFAFDGFPIYGPYESAGELAKDSKSNPLNEFNLHYDPQRGWHYHVTPGKFPHVIGGFWGDYETKNRRRPPPRNAP